jgi:LysM repeat protein
VLLLFTGCTLTRPDEASDIEEFTPPTVASAAQLSATEEATQTLPTQEAIQSAEALVRFQPASQNLQIGEAVAIEVRLEQVTNLVAADLRLQFNPGVVQVQDADPNKEGVQIGPGNFPSPDFVVLNVVTNTTGTILYAVLQIPPAEPVSGTGLLASITFQAVGQGESDLTMSTQLANSEGRAIPTMLEFSKIIVGVPGGEHDGDLMTPTPTFTASPSPTSTTVIILTPTVTGTTISLTPSPTPPLVTPGPTIPPTLPPPPTLIPTKTPSPPITQIPAGGTVGFCYRVKTGETLEGIAALNGTTAQAIQWANDLYPPYYTYVNQALFIPQGGSGIGRNFYIIQAGDTLDSIAETCNLPADFIAWVNKVDQAANFPTGYVLEIPRPPFPPPARYLYPPSGPFGPPSVFPPLSYGTYPPQQPSRPQPPQNGGTCDYVVQPGDTLYSICNRYGVSVEALKQTNGIYDANYIYAGQCLVIPNQGGW